MESEIVGASNLAYLVEFLLILTQPWLTPALATVAASPTLSFTISNSESLIAKTLKLMDLQPDDMSLWLCLSTYYLLTWP